MGESRRRAEYVVPWWYWTIRPDVPCHCYVCEDRARRAGGALLAALLAGVGADHAREVRAS